MTNISHSSQFNSNQNLRDGPAAQKLAARRTCPVIHTHCRHFSDAGEEL